MFLVVERITPLLLPLRLSDDGILYHAQPKGDFSVFSDVESATAAIGATVVARPDSQLTVVSVAAYEADLSAADKRKRKVEKAAKAAKGEAA